MNTLLDTIFPIIIFLFGTIIGSFLNVVILRYRSGRSISSGRSICFSCGKKLCFFELVPVGSFLTQRGRCTGCQTKISWQYPIVEALTGFLFVCLYFHFQYLIVEAPLLFAILFSYYAIIFCILIVLSVYDFKHKVLPDQLVLIFTLFAFWGMFLILGDSLVLHIPSYTQFIAGVVLPAPFSLLWLASKGKWMGLGDAKFMIGIGFLLGMSAGVASILFSFWIGAIVSILMIIYSKTIGKRALTLASAIPFGPFLALGTIIVILTGSNLWTIMQFIGGY